MLFAPNARGALVDDRRAVRYILRNKKKKSDGGITETCSADESVWKWERGGESSRQVCHQFDWDKISGDANGSDP